MRAVVGINRGSNNEDNKMTDHLRTPTQKGVVCKAKNTLYAYGSAAMVGMLGILVSGVLVGCGTDVLEGLDSATLDSSPQVMANSDSDAPLDTNRSSAEVETLAESSDFADSDGPTPSSTSNATSVEIYFCTDSWGSESSFNICGDDGNCVWDGDYGAGWIGNNACYSEYITLEDGDYTLYLDDSYGDGGLCAGVYEPGVGTFVDNFCASGYGSSATFTIGGAPASCEDQGQASCDDGQCIPTSYVCDGSIDTCNAGWGPDCADGSDESLANCGDDHDECVPDDPCAGAAYPSWAGDGYCDASNNVGDCWDGGDCCESTCVDGSYSCDSYGGCNGDCLDPNGNDDDCAPPPTCEEQGYVDCGDGQCIYESWECDGYADCANGSDEADCAVECADGEFPDCNGDCFDNGDLSYVGDGWCDDGSWGPVLTCDAFLNDGGD
jgi:hypothetical protein